jgi:hypothetical protein
VTTKTFLEAFGFASLRDTPDIEPFKTERSMQTGQGEPELDKALGLGDGEDQETLEGNDALWSCQGWVKGFAIACFHPC